ncbi:hypothetical protein AX17_004804 [Amanita inopinata Kibby_2008]|nr:hypothetical protein AX17_004804 [Amanita inopinata Kibby_2008]
MNSQLCLLNFPEELLERILALCVVASPVPTSSTHIPSWHTPAFHAQRTAPLLVCKTFNRIATPLLYYNIHLSSPTQAEQLADTLRNNPSFSPLIHRLILTTVTAHAARILSLCKNLSVLDFTLDVGTASAVSAAPSEPTSEDLIDRDAVEFSDALPGLSHLRHLVIRKPNAAYLTIPRIKFILLHLADALLSWDNLETANLAFKFADDSPSILRSNSVPSSPSSPSSPQGGPITHLTHALSTLPCLHTFATHLPSTWSEAILRVSTNKRLDRVVLTDGRIDVCIIPEIVGASFFAPVTEQQCQVGILGTGLFFMEARKHQRLSELIRAGTPIIRSRARTMGTLPASYYTPMAQCISTKNISSLSTTSPRSPSAPSLPMACPVAPSLSTSKTKRRNSSS